MTEEQQLQALLRLKRYEQPPAGYYEKLLRDVHRKQRSELLRRPLWSIAWERLQTLFSEHSMGNVSYAGAMAGVAVAGILAINAASKSGVGTGPSIASAATHPAASEAQPAELHQPLQAPQLAQTRLVAATAPVLTLDGDAFAATSDASDADVDDELHDARLLPAKAARTFGTVRQPRYVIDSRPVSYEAARVSFSF